MTDTFTEKTLSERLEEAAEQQQTNGNHELAKLLNEACLEIEVAMCIFDAAAGSAIKFMRRNSVIPDELSEDEIHILKHSLTGTSDKVYRNYFFVASGNPNLPKIEALIKKGYMQQGRSSSSGTYYHATEIGAFHVGLELPLDAGANGLNFSKKKVIAEHVPQSA